MLTFKVNVKVKLESFNSCLQLYLFFNFGSSKLESFIVFSTILIIIKRFRFFGIFYCFSYFGTILIIIIIIIIIKRFRFFGLLRDSFFPDGAIGIANLQNRITFSHQTQLIYGPLSDNVQRAFWC